MKRSIVLVLGIISLIAFSTLLLIDSLSAETTYEVVEGTWQKRGEPYMITRSLLIPKDKTLILGKGVKLFFSKNTFLRVEGTLLVKGSKDDRVFLTTNDQPKDYVLWDGISPDKTNYQKTFPPSPVDRWSGIIISQSGVFEIKYGVIDFVDILHPAILSEGECVLLNSHINGQIFIKRGVVNKIKNCVMSVRQGTAIKIEEPSNNNQIENNIIKGNQTAEYRGADGISVKSNCIHYVNTSPHCEYSEENIIKDNKITNCERAISVTGKGNTIVGNYLSSNSVGIRLTDGAVIVRNNRIENNYYGVMIDKTNFRFNASVTNNNIFNNSGKNLVNFGSDEIDVSKNWWGSNEKDRILLEIESKDDQAVIKIEPFLNSKAAF